MPKKSTKKKLSALQKFALYSLALLLLIVGGAFLYSFRGNPLIDESIKEKPIQEAVTYTLSSGWKESTNEPYLAGIGYVVLKSPDYKEPTTQSSKDGSGIIMSLRISPKYIFQTLKSLARDYKKSDFTEKEDISIDGIPGIKYIFNTDEEYFLICFLIKDKYVYQISANSYNHTNIDEKEINSVIDSIQFK